MDKDTLSILEAAQSTAARLLAKKVNEGKASAADIAQLRAMFKDVGGTLSFRDAPTSTGKAVLLSLDDVDPSLLN